MQLLRFYLLLSIILTTFEPMIHALLTTAPMLVSIIVTIQLILEQRQRKDRLLHWLIAWGVCTSLLYTGHFFYFHHAIKWIPLTNTIYMVTNVSVYPLYLIYLSDLTDRRPLSSRPKMLAWLLGPGIVMGISTGVLYGLMTEDEKTLFIEQFLYQDIVTGLTGKPLVEALLHYAIRILFALQVFGVAVTGIRKVRRYNHTVSQLYADTEDKEAIGLTTLLKLFVVTAFLSAIFNFIGRADFNHSVWLAVPAMLFSSLIFAIGWSGMNQRFSIRDIQVNSEQPAAKDEPEKHALNRKDMAEDELIEKLDHLVHNEKLFLEHDLRLEQVATQLGTNRTYLLNALNNCLHMTFKEYINRLRIAYAEQLMREHPTLSKSDIAMRAGYNTLSSFYRNYNVYHTNNKS